MSVSEREEGDWEHRMHDAEQAYAGDEEEKNKEERDLRPLPPPLYPLPPFPFSRPPMPVLPS